MSVLNVGVIGTGTMGKHHVRVYSELKEIENVYVFDTNPALMNLRICEAIKQIAL